MLKWINKTAAVNRTSENETIERRPTGERRDETRPGQINHHSSSIIQPINFCTRWTNHSILLEHLDYHNGENMWQDFDQQTRDVAFIGNHCDRTKSDSILFTSLRLVNSYCLNISYFDADLTSPGVERFSNTNRNNCSYALIV